jgi:hypothetical protein
MAARRLCADGLADLRVPLQVYPALRIRSQDLSVGCVPPAKPAKERSSQGLPAVIPAAISWVLEDCSPTHGYAATAAMAAFASWRRD